MEIWRLLLIGFDCFRLLARQTLGTHLSFIIDHTYLSHHKRHRNLISKLYTDGSLSRHCATSPWSFVLYDNSAIGKECQEMMWFLVDFVPHNLSVRPHPGLPNARNKCCGILSCALPCGRGWEELECYEKAKLLKSFELVFCKSANYCFFLLTNPHLSIRLHI